MTIAATTTKFDHQAASHPLSCGPEHRHIEQSFRENGFGASTYGKLGHRRIQESGQQEVEFDLEARLAALCDKLRARY